MDERSVLSGADFGFKFSGIRTACSAERTSCRRAFFKASVTVPGLRRRIGFSFRPFCVFSVSSSVHRVARTNAPLSIMSLGRHRQYQLDMFATLLAHRFPLPESWTGGVPSMYYYHTQPRFYDWDYPNTSKYTEKIVVACLSVQQNVARRRLPFL